jgi:hypothetical protein
MRRLSVGADECAHLVHTRPHHVCSQWLRRSVVAAQMVPGAGIEPAPPVGEGGLSPPRLPVSPPGQWPNTIRDGHAASRLRDLAQQRPVEPGGVPEIGAHPVGLRRDEPIGGDDPFDHVADDCRPRSIRCAYRDHRAGSVPSYRAIDADEARWTSKAGGEETAGTSRPSKGARRGGEVERRRIDGHEDIIATGCATVLSSAARNGPRRSGSANGLPDTDDNHR